MVLSQLAWVSGSPLFDAIDAAGSVPPYKDVALPSVAGVGRSSASPLLHPRVRKLGAQLTGSPLSTIHERHTSPGSTARRALFSPGGSFRKSPIPIAPKPPPLAKGGVTVQLLSKIQLQQINPLTSPSKDAATQGVGISLAEAGVSWSSPVKGAGADHPDVNSVQTSPLNSSPLMTTQSPPGAILAKSNVTASTVLSPSKAPPTTSPGSVHPLIPTSPPIPSVTVTQTTPFKGQMVTTPGGTSPRPKRTGSLALFYRKTYQLAFIRIKDLCERLGLATEFIQK